VKLFIIFAAILKKLLTLAGKKISFSNFQMTSQPWLLTSQPLLTFFLVKKKTKKT
jgi:hypothetical protein